MWRLLHYHALLSVLWTGCLGVAPQCHGQEESAPRALPSGDAEELLNLRLDQLRAALNQLEVAVSTEPEREIRAVDETYRQIESKPDYVAGRVIHPLKRIHLKGGRCALYRGNGLVLAVPIGGKERDHFVVISDELESEVVSRDSTLPLLQANQITLSRLLLLSGPTVYELITEPMGLRVVHSGESRGSPYPLDLFECGRNWVIAEKFKHERDGESKPVTRQRLRFLSSGLKTQESLLLETFGASTFRHSVVLEEGEGAIVVCGDRAVHISPDGDVGKPVIFSRTPKDTAIRPHQLQGCRLAVRRRQWAPVSRSWSRSATALCWDGTALTAVSFRVPNSLHPRGLVIPAVCSAVVGDMLVTRGNQSEFLYGFRLPTPGDRGCAPGEHSRQDGTPPVWGRTFPSMGGAMASFYSLGTRACDAIQVGLGSIYFLDPESGLVRFRFSIADEPGAQLVPSHDELRALAKSKHGHGIFSYVVFGDFLLATTEELNSDIVVWRIPKGGDHAPEPKQGASRVP